MVNFVKRLMIEDGKDKIFNVNTTKKDVGVLLQSLYRTLQGQVRLS